VELCLLYFDGCPNWQVAEERLHSALAQLEIGAPVQRVLVADQEQAERLCFSGSPTILVEGRDPFAARGAQQPGMACRLYRTPNGLAGAPTVEQLVEVLSAASHHA
jgi:hypothetical protein